MALWANVSESVALVFNTFKVALKTVSYIGNRLSWTVTLVKVVEYM